MTAPTHLIVYFSIANLIGIPINAQSIILGILGTILPDISNPNSLVGNFLKPVSSYLFRKYGHRTITHSWLAIAFATPPCLIAYFLLDTSSALIFLFALLMHIITDMINVKGVHFMYPEKLIFVMPNDPNYRIETGSVKEKRFAIVMAIILALSLPFGIYGYQTIIRTIAGSSSAIIEEYKTSIHSHEIFVKVQNGINRVTQQTIHNQIFKVVAIMPKKVLLCEDDYGNRITIGQAEEAIIDTKKLSIIKGVPTITEIRQIDIKEEGWNSILEELSNPYAYAIGEIEISETPHYIQTPGIWNGIEITGNKIYLNYADIKTVQRVAKYNATEGIITIKKELSKEGILTPLFDAEETLEIYNSFLVNVPKESILVKTGQYVKEGDIIAISPEADRYQEEIIALRQKIITTDIDELKASALADKNYDLNMKIANLDKQIEIQKRIIEKTKQTTFLEAEKLRLERLIDDKATLIKEREEITRSLKEEKEYINKKKDSIKKEIHAQINAIKAKIKACEKTSPYTGFVANIKQKSANVFEIKINNNIKEKKT